MTFPENLVSTLHLEKRPVVKARISRGMEVRLFVIKQKSNLYPLQSFLHNAYVTRSCFINDQLVFTANANHVAKLTRIDLLKSTTTEYNELQYPEEGTLNDPGST